MFAELSAQSNFTFLTGASHPEEYMRRAAALGLSGVAIGDDNSVAGIVRAHTEARVIARLVQERRDWDAGNDPIGPPRPGHLPALVPVPASFPVFNAPRLIPGARICCTDAPPVTALPVDREGWGRLCRLISKGRLRAEKGECDLQLADLVEHAEGLELLIWPGRGWQQAAWRLRKVAAGRLHLLLVPRYDGRDAARFDRLAEAAAHEGLPTLASAAPRMHHGRRRRLADVLTAICEGVRVDDLGRAAMANGEQRLRSEAELRRMLGPHEGAVDRAADLAARLDFTLDVLRYEYPSEVAEGKAPLPGWSVWPMRGWRGAIPRAHRSG